MWVIGVKAYNNVNKIFEAVNEDFFSIFEH